jgi:uncharacterized protein YjbJ (UPF0337 family)
MSLISTVVVVLFVLWLLGFSIHIGGSLIHILLVLALIGLVYNLFTTGRHRVKAAQKDVEGEVQEAIGNVTGNRKDQIMGTAKQVESRVMNAIEDVKDQSRDILH